MYIMWHPLNFLISLVACFITYCVVWLVYRDNVQYLPLLVIQISPSPESPLTSDEVAEYNQACICLKFYLSPNMVWFLVALVMTFLLTEHFLLSQPQMLRLLNVSWKPTLTMFPFSFSTYWWNLFHDLGLWLCDEHNEMRPVLWA
jgi:hypothetical protein